jgi:FtsH-binding integral membrane protein
MADYANVDPSALWHAGGATAAFVAATGAYGYATRRDLSCGAARSLGRFSAFVSIPDSNIVYTVAGLGIFGAFTIFDFNRLRRSTVDAAVPIAAGTFLDAFNVFLLVLDLFGGRRDEPGQSTGVARPEEREERARPRPGEHDAGRGG